MRPHIPIENPPITQARLHSSNFGGQAWLGIWYSPLPGEIDPASLEIVKRLNLKPWKIVPPHADTDPFELARAYCHTPLPDGTRVYILVPGTAFDRFGTRHGRGGGWYDRFLSKLPRGWMRIGVVPNGKLIDEPLPREAWDEPMDWLVF